MNTAKTLIQSLSDRHLLKHPFYQAWTAGTLTIDNLKNYAEQYYVHVNAFPRYISAAHANCDDIKARQVLLENLTDEEKGEENHPELWMRFAEALGSKREDVLCATPNAAVKNLVDTFMSLSKSSYAEGLGALFAYEHQVPEVAKTKIEGLEKFYGIKSENGLKFFKVHLEADVYHTQEVAALIENLTGDEKQKAFQAARKASNALWDFLSSMQYPDANC